MTDSHKVMLQNTARRVYELRNELERARREKDQAVARYEEVSKQLREVEGRLTQTVGPNVDRKMWMVDAGVAVLAQYHNNTCTTVTVLDAEVPE